MAFYKPQFNNFIIRTLNIFDEKMAHPTAINLMLGTAAQESKFGTYLQQLDNGGALGVYQMEYPTFQWLKEVYSDKYPQLMGVHFSQIEYDLKAATIFGRLRYWVNPSPLPENKAEELAKYWKLIYNTVKGKGTVEDFIKNYNKYVGK